jgi:hypothetical protein
MTTFQARAIPTIHMMPNPTVMLAVMLCGATTRISGSFGVLSCKIGVLVIIPPLECQILFPSRETLSDQ